jgi:hypothetical protein
MVKIYHSIPLFEGKSIGVRTCDHIIPLFEGKSIVVRTW